MTDTNTQPEQPGHTGDWLDELIAAAMKCDRVGVSNGSDSPENRERCKARAHLQSLTTPAAILRATQPEAGSE
ncbi:MAG: hypothetical protein EON59_11925 [Alphaproteobacteria bacterium]|nr:MAG: hypothetical protein EON59_11925 [Alphaproteobacteria bacterium]